MPAIDQTQQNIITGVGLKLVDLLRRQATPLARGVACRQEVSVLIGSDPVPRRVVIIIQGDQTFVQVGETSIGLRTLTEAAGRERCPGGIVVPVIVAWRRRDASCGEIDTSTSGAS